MGQTIDKRVVQMRFDNKSFESNAKATMNTLSKLKAALSNLGSSSKSLSGLNKVGNTNALDQIAQSVGALEKRFSTLGIVGMRVIQNLTDGLTSTLGKGLEYVKSGIVEGGVKRATNIENAHYQLQTLLKDESKVQAVMDNANAAVDGTAYSFDEAAKAASMFAASGIKAGEPMENALKGIVGTAAMTNSEFERISLIFTSVAGQGRLMGDQLLQLSSLGLNAPATIADYFNKIDEASTKASDEVRKSVKEISQGKEVTEADIRELVSDGQISFKIFAEAMYDAFGESAEKANETFQGSMSNIKSALARIGAGFISPLIEQNSSVINLINRIREKINEVKKALVFDEELNNVGAYSKRFTDFVLGMADDMSTFVSNLDVASGMEVFYNVVDSIINVLKGLGSILAPIGQAFADVFLSFNVGDVINATASLKDFTSGLKLSSEQSKNLHDAVQGVFSVIKMLAGGLINLIAAIFPVTGSVSSLGDGILSLAGSIGRGLTAFASWVSESKLVAAAFELIKKASSSVWGAITKVIDVIKNLVAKAAEMNIVGKAVDSIAKAFEILWQIAEPAIQAIVSGFKMLGEIVVGIAALILGSAWETLVYMFEKLQDTLSNFNVKHFRENIDGVISKVKDLVNLGKGGFGNFVGNMKKLGENIKQAFNFKSIVENLKAFKSLVTEFVGWFKETFGNLFGGASFGGIVASGGGIALVYSIIEISKALKEATGKLDSVPKVLESLSGAIKSYGSTLKADAIKKNSEAILILAAALAVLSFTDTDSALKSALALSLVSKVLMEGTAKLLQATSKGNVLTSSLNSFARGLGKAFNQLGKAAKWAAIGGAFNSFGESILMVAGSIIALGLMYKNDADALREAESAVAIIAAVMLSIMTVMSKLSKSSQNGNAGFLKSAGGLALVALSLASVIKSISKVMKIDLPDDYAKKIAIVSGLLLELSVLAILMGKASKNANGNSVKAGTILALAIALKSVVSSIKSVLDIDLPSDWLVKVGILAAMMAGLGYLINTIGDATKTAGSALKGVGVLLGLAVDIAIITTALTILSIIPGDGMLRGAIALGAVILALSKSLKSASSISGKDSYKTVLSMAVNVAAIAASLGVLSLIPVEKLTKAAIALGVVLLSLSKNIQAASGIKEGSWKPLVAMVAAVVSIAASLVILSAQPWENMLAAGASMSAVLLSFSLAFRVVSNSGDMNVGKAATFLAMTLAVIPIGIALSQLAAHPWQSLLAAAGALSATILAYTIGYQVLSNSETLSVAKAVSFLGMTLAVIPIGLALSQLSSYPWSGLLAGAAALSATILAYTAAYFVLSSADSLSVGKAASFLAMTLAAIPIGAALGQLAGQSWSSMLGAAAAMSGTLIAFTAAFKIISGSKPNVGAVASFVAASLALIPISGALNMLAGQSWNSLLPAATSLIAVGAALVAAMKIMGSAATSIVGVVSFVAAAIALIPIAGVINSLSGLSWGEVATGLITLAGGLTIIGVAGVAGVAIAPGLLALSAALIVFAGAIAAIGAALPVFIDGLTAVFEALSKADAIIGEHISSMVDAGYNLMAGLLEGIASGASAVVEGIKSVGENIISGICSVLGIASPSTVFEAIGLNVDAGFSQGITGGSDSISSAMESVFGGIADQVDLSAFTGKGEEGASLFGSGLLSGEGDIDSIINSLVDSSGADVSSFLSLGDQGVGNLGKGLASGESNINSIMAGLMDVSGIDVSGMYKLGTEGAQGMDKGLKSGDPNVKKTVKQLTNVSGVDVSNYTSLGKKAADAFTKGAQSGAKSGSSTAASSIAKTLKSAIDSSVKGLNFTSAGKSISESISKGIKSGSSSAKTAAQSVAKAAASAVKSQDSTFKAAGTKSMSSYATGLKSKSGEVTNAVKSVAKKASDALKSDIKSYQKVGSEMISGVVKGIKSKESNASSAAKEVASKIVSGLQGKVKDFQSPGREAANTYIKALSSTINSGMQSLISQMATKGRQIVHGLANGINANMGVAKSAASALARSIDQQIKSDLQIHSPSKVAETRGKQIVDGLAKGLDGGKAKVKNVTKAITNIIRNDLSDVRNEVNGWYNQIDGWESVGNAIKAMTSAKNGWEPIGRALEQMNKPKNGWESIGKAIEGITGSKMGWRAVENAAISVTTAENGWESIGRALTKMTEVKDGWEGIGNALTKMTEVKDGWAEIGRAMDKKLIAETGKGLYETAVIKQEEEFWENLLATKQAGAEKEKYIDMEMNEFRQEMADQYTSIMNEYNEAIKQEKESVRGWYNPFQEIDTNSLKTREKVAEEEYQAALKEAAAEDLKAAAEKKAKKTSKSKKETVKEETKVSQVRKENVTSFNKILKEQSDGYKLYNKTYTSLEKKLKGTKLWDYVKEQGVDSMQFLLEIDQLSNKGLKKAIKQYDENMEEADKIAKKRSKETAKSTKKAIKDLFEIDGSAKDAAAKQYLDSLTLEEQYWAKLLAVKQNGVESEKYMEMEIQDFRTEMLNGAKDLMVDFNSQTEQIKQNMRDSFGLFSEINTQSSITAEEILNNAKARLSAFTEYSQVMDELASKLAGTSVWSDYLSDMGVNDLGNLRAVNSMTDEQLSELASTWELGSGRANEAAKTGIEKIKETTTQELAALLDVPVEEINLDDFVKAFDGTAESLEAVILNIGTTVAKGKEDVTAQAKELMENIGESISSGFEEVTSTIEKNGQEVGASVGEQIAAGMTTSTEVVAQAAQTVAQGASTAMSSEEGGFQQVGQSAGQTYANGVSEKQQVAENAGTTIANSTLEGISSKNEAAGNVGTSLAMGAVTAINSQQQSFYSAGVNLGQGFVNGIGSMISAAASKASQLASAAKSAIDSKLDIHSPSRVMFQSGMFTGIGFVNGIMSCIDKAARASEELGDSAVGGIDTGLSDIFTDDMFSDPIIRPEVDLENVYNSLDDICKLFNDAIQIAAIDAEAVNVNLTSRQRRNSDQSELQKSHGLENGENVSYNFVQNNYSPKALSEADIYRQTKNQFTMFRTAVGRA